METMLDMGLILGCKIVKDMDDSIAEELKKKGVNLFGFESQRL